MVDDGEHETFVFPVNIELDLEVVEVVLHQLKSKAVFAAVWCTSSSITSSSHRFGPDGLSMERLNAFLRNTGTIFRGPLILPDIPIGATHVDEGLRPPIEESYNFYLPAFGYDYNEKLQPQKRILTELTPPKLANEPNFYSRKQKKYPKKYSPSLKQVNIKPVVEDTYEPKYEPSINMEGPKIAFDDEYFEGTVHPSTPTTSIHRHAGPKFYLIPSEVESKNETIPQDEPDEEEKTLEASTSNGDNSRIEYQIHGFNGPKSYKFGFDTERTDISGSKNATTTEK